MDTQNAQTPPPVSPTPTGVDNDKVMGILSYLGILILVPLLATKSRSAFLNYHINQGLGLIIVWVIGWGAVSILPILFFLMPIWQILMLILIIMGIINVTKNETKPLPVIGNWFHLIK